MRPRIAEQVGLERSFVQREGAYQVQPALRDLCIFSSHSFIKDPPFSRLDLISCRNVMIYLGLDLQQKIIPVFHYALRSGGYLFLGPAENATSHRELLRTVNKRHRIYQRKESVGRPYGMTRFSTGQEAVGVLCAREGAMTDALRPDAILVDLNTPKSDGFEVLRKLKETPHLADVLIAIISSSPAPSNKKDTGLLGGNRYLEKPSQLEEFLAKVGQAIKEMLDTG